MESSKAPWKSKRIPGMLFELTDADENPVLRLRGGMMPSDSDARLLESAPELLQVVKDLLNPENGRGGSDKLWQVWDRAKELVTKIESK